ncbi:unnamed protein product [Sphagnum troendelagicum]
MPKTIESQEGAKLKNAPKLRHSMLPSSIWIENTMSGAKRKCSNDQITSAQPTSPSVSSPTLHPHLRLQAQHLADQPHLCLRFSELEKMTPHFWAETKLKNVDGFPTQVELVDARTGNVVSNGAESSATFHVVVLEGSSGAEVEADIDKGNWKELVVKPRDGRKSLLVGGLKVTLKEGKGSLDTNLRFKDNSSFVSSKKFRLGLEDISGSHIQGAVTNAFHVKDARGKSNGKKEVPAENDTLDVLVHIAKGGARLHHLNSVFKITTVKEFNLFYKENPKALRAGLNRLSDESFAAIIENAERCQQEEPGLQLVEMAQKQTTNGYCIKEGSAMISMSPDASGVLMSGVNNEFNLPEQQQSIFLGDPAGDHVIRKEDLPGTSQSGIPGGVLPSPALQQNSQLLESPPHTDPWSNGTAFDIPDDLLMEDGLTIDEIPFGYFHGSTVPFT